MLVTPETLTLREPLVLGSGESLHRPVVGFERYGALSPARDNVVLVCPSMTHSAHAAGRHHAHDPKPGWWDAAIGPGRMLDTDRFCVLSVDTLGGGGASSGPRSIDPVTGEPYGTTFPFVTVDDMVELQRRLLDELGVERLAAAIGGCMGGFQVLQWISAYPARIARGVFICAGARTSAHTIARNEVCRQAVRLDPGWQGGRYDPDDPPTGGMRLAAMIGALTWLGRGVLERRHGRRRLGGVPRFDLRPEFEVEALVHRVARGSEAGIDPNALLYVTRALDYFDLESGVERLDDRFRGWDGAALAISYATDWRYPPEETEDVVQALTRAGVSARHVVLEGDRGHVSFLLEPEVLRPHVESFLEA